jgi:hypothetical protein
VNDDVRPSRPARVPRTAVYPFEQVLPTPVTKTAAQVVSVDDDETMTVQIGDDTLSGVYFAGRTPASGDLVELDERGDLLVAIEDAFTEGVSQDALHIVSVDEPAEQEPTELVEGGNPPAQDRWVVWGQWEPAWDAAGVTLTQRDGLTPTITHVATLPTGPGRTYRLQLQVFATADTGQPAVLPFVVLGGADAVQMLPWSDDAVALDGPWTPLPVDDTTTVVFDVTIPDSITPATGATDPHLLRVGTYVLDNGATGVAVTINRVSLLGSDEGFPLGSIWFDPSATPAATSLDVYGPSGASSANVQLTGPAQTWLPVPGPQGCVLTVQPPADGIIAVWASVSVTLRATAPVVFRLISSRGGTPTYARLVAASSTADQRQVFSVLTLPLAVDEEVEFWLEYFYANAALPGTLHDAAYVRFQTMFVPGAIRSSQIQERIERRYWDGDSWRPAVLEPMALQGREQGTAAPSKTATTTTCVKSHAVRERGQKLDLSSKVSASSGTPTGSVTFYWGRGSSAGAVATWTKIATSTLKTVSGAQQATASWTVPSGATLASDYWFQARYGGSSTHAASQGNTSNALQVTAASGGGGTTQTKTFTAKWQQAYDGGGGQIAGSGNDNAVHQGYYSPTHGNRRSLVGFDVSLPAGANVTKVVLKCKSWQHWYYNGGGTLRVGWHDKATRPASFGVGAGTTAASSHDVGAGSWSITLPAWARTAVARSAFQGIVIGPGAGDSRTYYGYSANSLSGAGLQLVITYET